MSSDYPIINTQNITLSFISPYSAPDVENPIIIRLMETDWPVENPLSITIRFVDSYSIPGAEDNITLDFGGSGDIPEPEDVEIIQGQSEIYIDTSIYEISIMEILAPEDSEIRIYDNSGEVTVIVEIEPEQTEIKCEFITHNVEHLPETIAETTYFITFSNEKNTSGGQANDLPNNIGTGNLGMGWKKTVEAVHYDFNTSWEQGTDLRLSKEKAWKQAMHINEGVQSPFIASMLHLDDFDTIPWGDFENKSDAENTLPYIGIMNFIDTFEKHSYGGFIVRDEQQECIYNVMQLLKGDFKDTHKRKRWNKPEYYDFSKRNSFNNDVSGQVHDKHHGTYWGPYWYSLWCQEQYFPWKGNEEVHLVLKSDFPLLQYPDFLTPSNPRCPFGYWYSGNRDNPDPPPPYEGPIMPLVKGFYYMNNTVFVKRLPSMEDIEVQSITMSIDMDSFLWDFSLTIVDKSYLNLIKPQDDTFIDIQININGYEWTCRVEEWSENITFNQRSWIINGRSPSIELAEPFCNPFSYKNDTTVQATTIVTDLLNLTNWSYVWESSAFLDTAMDWLIPANLFSFTNESIIHGIKQLVNTAGHFINTVPNTNTIKELQIKPIYKEQPWNWYHSTISPDILLVDAQCWEIGRKYNRKSKIDSIVLAGIGEASGILSTVKKEGTAGTYTAPMITSPLFTTPQVIRERGRMEIAESGNWIEHSIKLFSLRPAPEGVGLAQIGELAEFNESGNTWRGIIKSVSVNVDTRKLNTAMHVDQQIEILEYQNE